jgi:hypothetical protein
VVGKLMVLQSLLQSFKANNERVVIVSNYTKTLNIIQQLCVLNQYKFSRLDGSTDTKKRQQLVDSFNAGHSNCCMLLAHDPECICLTITNVGIAVWWCVRAARCNSCISSVEQGRRSWIESDWCQSTGVVRSRLV